MRLSDAITGFCLTLTSERYSNRTVDAYKTILTHLSQYLSNPPLLGIQEADLRRYFIYITTEYKPKRFSGNTSPLASSSVNKAWIAVRSFFRWSTDEFKLDRNPALAIKHPEYTTKAIVPFSEAEIKRLLKACARSYRNQALLMLLLDTGLRVGEACRLLVRDVDLETGEVNVIAFGSGRKTKSRTVYLGKGTRRAVWRYLAERNDDSPSLLLSKQFQPMTRNAVRVLLAKLGQRANVQGCHPHRFRHTFAIQYLRNGGDMFTLQRLLGHSSLEMVRHYLALARSDDATAHKSASPVDRWQL